MKQLLTTLVVFSISSLLFIACSDKAASSTTEETKSTFDLAAVKKVIDSTNAVYASLVKKGDSVALAGLYTSDAKVMVSNMPAGSGRKEIQSILGGMIAALGTVDLVITTTDVWGTESLVAEEGTVNISKDGNNIDKGKYIVLWKMEDGNWKIFRDIFNSDLPSMAPPK